MVVLLAAFVAAIAFFVFSLIRGTDVYKDALARARTHPEVVERLGSPIEPKWWLFGNISLQNNDGEADFAVPIRGPKGDGTILVEATKKDGRWTYSQLVVDTPGGQIELLSAEPSTEESRDTAPPGG